MSTGCWAAPGALYPRRPRRRSDDGHARCRRRGGTAARRRSVGRPCASRVWQQAFVSARMIQFFAWAQAAIFPLETLAAFTWSRDHEWRLYRPVSLAIAVLALVVAGSGGAWSRVRRHRPPRLT